MKRIYCRPVEKESKKEKISRQDMVLLRNDRSMLKFVDMEKIDGYSKYMLRRGKVNML